jgi:hypothetical protein
MFLVVPPAGFETASGVAVGWWVDVGFWRVELGF